jgi:hypothetical protein
LIGWLARAKLRVRDVVVRPIYANETSGVRLHHALFVIPYVLGRLVVRRASAHLRAQVLGSVTSTTLPVSVVGLVTSDSHSPPQER